MEKRSTETQNRMPKSGYKEVDFPIQRDSGHFALYSFGSKQRNRTETIK